MSHIYVSQAKVKKAEKKALTNPAGRTTSLLYSPQMRSSAHAPPARPPPGASGRPNSSPRARHGYAATPTPGQRPRHRTAAAALQPGNVGPRLGWPSVAGFDQHYKLGALLASGSYGSVYAGTHVPSGNAVAVKVLPTRRASAAAAGRGMVVDTLQQLQRLEREVDLISKVAGCQNVGKVEAVYESDDTAYVVLRFVDGGDLEEVLAARGGTPFTEREAAVVAFELLKVVAACHAAGVVHGDVKPANIMLSCAGAAAAIERGEWAEPFLALQDFGLARACVAGATVQGTRGTPVYMAPEVFLGCYGQPADIYAVGVTLHYMLSLKYLFWPTREEVLALTPRAVRGRVLAPDTAFDGAQLPASASASVHALLGALLARDAADRPTAVTALSHPWFQLHVPEDAIAAPGAPADLRSILAHKSAEPCAACTLTACALAGHGPPTPLTRVVDDGSAGEVGGSG